MEIKAVSTQILYEKYVVQHWELNLTYLLPMYSETRCVAFKQFAGISVLLTHH